jgi:hypothetical protein
MKYESPITYHSKDMANVKVFCRQTDKQTDRQTGQKLYAPDLSIRGYKKSIDPRYKIKHYKIVLIVTCI